MYGLFLIKVMNNDYDGIELLHKIQHMYQGMNSKFEKDRRKAWTTEMKYSESSGAVMAVISASTHNFCQIIHINDEIEAQMGYKRKLLLGRNVNVLMP